MTFNIFWRTTGCFLLTACYVFLHIMFLYTMSLLWHHLHVVLMTSYYGDNLPVWPPSLNCAGCWPLTQLQLSVLTAVLRVLVPVSWEPGPGYTGLHRSELLQSLQQAAAVRDLAEGGIIVKNAVSNNYYKRKTYCQALVPNPRPISPQSLQTQSQPSPTQFETQINPKGTGADTKIL